MLLWGFASVLIRLMLFLGLPMQEGRDFNCSLNHNHKLGFLLGLDEVNLDGKSDVKEYMCSCADTYADMAMCHSSLLGSSLW